MTRVATWPASDFLTLVAKFRDERDWARFHSSRMLPVVGRRPRSARAHGRDRSRDGGRPHLPRDARGSPRRRPRPCGARKARRGRQEISGDGGEGRSLGRPRRGARDSRGGETHGRERSSGDVEPRGGRRSDVFSGGNLRTSCGLCPGRGGLRPGTRWHGSRAGRRRRVEAGSVSRFEQIRLRAARLREALATLENTSKRIPRAFGRLLPTTASPTFAMSNPCSPSGAWRAIGSAPLRSAGPRWIPISTTGTT